MKRNERTLLMVLCAAAAIYILGCGIWLISHPSNFNHLASGTDIFGYCYLSGLCLIAFICYGGLTYSHWKKLQYPWL